MHPRDRRSAEIDGHGVGLTMVDGVEDPLALAAHARALFAGMSVIVRPSGSAGEADLPARRRDRFRRRRAIAVGADFVRETAR